MVFFNGLSTSDNDQDVTKLKVVLLGFNLDVL